MFTVSESVTMAILSAVASVLIAAPARFSAIVIVSITAMAGVFVSLSVSLSKYTN